MEKVLRLCSVLAMAMSAIAMGAAPAQADEPAPVLTRAKLVSSFEAPDGKLYVRLKLQPNAKIPFTTQTFRLPDRALLAEVPDGSPVKFSAKRIDGENVVTSIRVVAECKRFQPCD